MPGDKAVGIGGHRQKIQKEDKQNEDIPILGVKILFVPRIGDFHRKVCQNLRK